MPFGLRNAPATFKRLMELVLTGLIGDACLVYLDDITIVGRTFEEHLQNLERVLMKIQSTNLKLSPKKCSLFNQQVSFLGYLVSEDGIRIKDLLVLKDKTQVKAFLAKPLHEVTEKKHPYIHIAFQELKDSLCKTPILGYPDAGKEF
ncbi:unnamed protein product [Parnassius mnemosyne]|uniref:Reverse transcriptase domain-containing protein n=1 Tax=Parnassius mnemosyne TaxID=213953 RepID=A0AAV1MA41_9NEOP